jgi:tetratricopeptide (TPR) repeat protein
MDKTKIFEAAGKFAAKGQLEKAAKEYQRILDEDAKDVRALQKLAEILQKSGRGKESTDLMLRVAEGYTEQGFFLKAVAVYKQILKVGPDRIEVNQKLAQLYQQLGLIGDATQQYQLVANHYDKLGNAKESLAALRKMVELDPDNVASQVKLGELYARENMPAEAIGELRKAAAYLKSHNRGDDQFRVLERVGQLAPDDPTVARELAQGYLARGDTKRALSRLQVCFRADPKDVETLQLLAQAFSALGQHAKTVSVYRELAAVHAAAGRTDAERDTLQKILGIAPQDEEALGRMRELSPSAYPPNVIAPPAPAPTSPPARAPYSAPATPSARVQPSVRAAPPAPAAPAPPPAPARPASRPPAAAKPLDPDVPPAIARMLTETEVYLKYNLLPKAADHMRKAVAEAPTCIPAHEKLLAILDRQNKSDEALKELEQIVQLARAAGNADADRTYTQDLAQRAPNHPLVKAAAQAADLPELDGEEELVIEADAAAAEPPRLTELAEDTSAPAEAPAELDPPAGAESLPHLTSLASEQPPEEAIRWEAPVSRDGGLAPDDDDEDELGLLEVGPKTLGGFARAEETPDLYAAEEQVPRARTTAPGPSYSGARSRESFSIPSAPHPMGADESPVAESTDPSQFPGAVRGVTPTQAPLDPPLDPPLDEPLDPPALADGVAEQTAAVDTPAPAEGLDLFAEEIAEAEFFVQQGLLDDARTILEEVLRQAPHHAHVAALLRDLGVPVAAEEPPQPAPPPPALVEARGYDLGKELSQELSKVEETVRPPAASAHSVNDVLAEFKKALSSTVSAEDSQTHYDLGIAYKEMGLYDEAIHEFEVASEASGRRHVLDCLTMLGFCYLERGEPQKALARFEEALRAPGLTLAASKEAHFEIAHCQELLGNDEAALDHYARVYKADQSFRDVRARLARLTQKVRGAGKTNGGGPAGAPAITATPPVTPASPVAPPVPPPPAPAAKRPARGKIGYI